MINIISNDIAALYAEFVAASGEVCDTEDELDYRRAEAASGRADAALDALTSVTPRTQAEVAILAHAALAIRDACDAKPDFTDPLSRLIMQIWRLTSGETGEPTFAAWFQNSPVDANVGA
ncbi:hypothetical protein [Methylocella sp.]|uniref:hypothetical protein n=1 Tax=Methylocella sp. TaxID=1978226 RepID=UPI0035B0E417